MYMNGKLSIMNDFCGNSIVEQRRVQQEGERSNERLALSRVVNLGTTTKLC